MSNAIMIAPVYKNSPVRISGTDDDPLFCAADVCQILEIGDNRSAVSRLDEDERVRIETATPGGIQEMVYVTEPGLYSLVLGSRKPEARAFKRWITHEVMPSIRKTGFYSVPSTNNILLLDKAQATVFGIESVAKDLKLDDRSLVAAKVEILKRECGIDLGSMAPQLPSRLYSATKLASEFGISPQKLGKIAKSNGVQADSSMCVVTLLAVNGGAKQVSQYQYTDKGRERIRELLSQ